MSRARSIRPPLPLPPPHGSLGWLTKMLISNPKSYLVPRLLPRPQLLCYRGQPAKYSLLAPSLSRFDSPHKRQHQRAAVWMHIALQLWADAKFRFSTGNDGWLKGRPYRLVQGGGSRTSRPALRSRDEPYRLDVG